MGALAVVAALVAGGCGPVNAGSAFQEQFEPFLAERDDLLAYDVRSQNPLPWSGSATVIVDLEPDLSRQEMIETIWAIAHHDVDDFIDYQLIARFPSRAGDGGEAVTSVLLLPSEPVPDEERVRRTIGERMDQADALVALGSGSTVLDRQAVRTRFLTGADALGVWLDLCEDRELMAQVDGALEVITADVDLGPGINGPVTDRRASVDNSGAAGCPVLPGAARVVDAARELGEIVNYSLSTYAGGDRAPSLIVEMAEPPEDVTEPTRIAAGEGVDLTIR